MALWADDAAPRRAVLVVCGRGVLVEGLGRGVLGRRPPRGRCCDQQCRRAWARPSADAAATKVLTSAAAAANTAVVANTDPASESPASCTFVAVTIDGNLLRHANIGDSRAYWFC